MDQLPARFNPAELARSGRTNRTTLPVSHFSRFAAILADDSGDVEVEVTFGWTEDKHLVANGAQTSQVKMTCQRCQRDLPAVLTSKFSLVFVAGEADAEELPEDLDPVIIGDSEDIHVVDFIEDELILQIPSRVVHMDESDRDPAVIAALSGSQDVPAKTHNPFKGLDKLLDT